MINVIQNELTKFILLPYNCKVPQYPQSCYDQHMQFKEWLKQNNKPFIDIRDFSDQIKCYENYECNWHHFTLQTQYDLIIPKMDELLHFRYNKDDFELVPYFVDDNDLSYLKPKKEYQFLIQSKSNYGGSDDNSIKAGVYYGNFNALMDVNSEPSEEFSRYHRLYRFPHRCSNIINLSINNNRILLLSGDSQNIPQIPILACYFKQIVYLDRRKADDILDYNNIQFTDILISLFDMACVEKYIYNNLII